MNQEIHINKKIYTTRPKDEQKRLKKELLVYDLLEKLEIPFERLDHSPTNTVESCMKVEEILEIEISKNLFLTTPSKDKFYLYFMPGNKRFKSGIVSRQAGTSRLSFADEAYMEEFLDITPGSVSVLGLMNDTENKVNLLIDSDILEMEYIGCHPCVNTSSLKIKTQDLLEKFLNYVNHDYTIINLPWE